MHRTILRSLVCVSTTAFVSLLLAEAGSAQEVGLAVGSKAPGFELVDQGGKRRALKDFLKEGNVALVFHRSADW